MSDIIKKLGITPGPWSIEKDIYKHTIIKEEWVIAECTPAIEDVSLIAAAPEMLEALIKDLFHYEWEMDIDLWGRVAIEKLGDDQKEWFIQRIKIIEKATSKTWEEVRELLLDK